LGRRRRQLLFCRSRGRHVRYLHGDVPHPGWTDSTDAEDDDVWGAGQGPAQGLTNSVSRHRVSRDRLPIERCAQLGGTALGGEIDVVQAKALFVSIGPFK